MATGVKSSAYFGLMGGGASKTCIMNKSAPRTVPADVPEDDSCHSPRTEFTLILAFLSDRKSHINEEITSL